MGVPIIDTTGPMTVKDFYAFTDTRPDNEKWELIDGEAVLNASPSRPHQRIIKNLSFILTTFERRPGTSWEVLPGLGVRVSETSRPGPDVLVIPRLGCHPIRWGCDRSDVIVAFEILSPLTEQHDLRLEEYRLHRPRLADALHRRCAGSRRSGRLHSRRRLRGATLPIARRIDRVAVHRHLAATFGNLPRLGLEIGRRDAEIRLRRRLRLPRLTHMREARLERLP